METPEGKRGNTVQVEGRGRVLTNTFLCFF